MPSLSTKLTRNTRALDKGTVCIATGMITASRVSGVIATVRSMTTLGSDLAELVLGQVGEVGGVGRSHFVDEELCE